MKNKYVVYGCIVGNYDRVFPPVKTTPGVDYILFTDDSNLSVNGWDVRALDASVSTDPSTINRYYKFFGHQILSEYDVSVYIDGNIRVLEDLSTLLKEFKDSKCAIGFHKHYRRENVQEELLAAGRANKINNIEIAQRQVNRYLENGMPQDLLLTENFIIYRNHSSERLDEAMSAWWHELINYSNRDQLSLGFVRWKHNLKTHIYLWNPRIDNEFYYVYPHNFESTLGSIRRYIRIRRFDSRKYLAAYYLFDRFLSKLM
ncbi:Uncharacterised protein [BD1-7 clade bacterium]|uniref:TOD1/MUCI70 glycosyltransferase-like domain-containing protein n=1 Tax=BD1-7 clade bacterium TaxID=2029982 RepID=A0A5S9R1N1_9GAMM|nr:Uncharacterised protein [BD1-7 clade bacterium]